MKKFLSIILALLMLLSLGACTGNNKSKKSGGTSKNEATTEEITLGASEPTTPAEPVTLTPNNTQDVSLGVIGDTYYENEYFGFGVSVPSDWEVETSSHVAELNSVSLEDFEGDADTLLSSKDFVYTFKALDPVNNNNVSVSVESLKAKGASGLSAEEYLKNVAMGYISTMEGYGVTDIEKEVDTVEISGQLYDYCALECEVSGVKLITIVFAFATEDYVASSSFTIYDSEDFGYLDDYIFSV